MSSISGKSLTPPVTRGLIKSVLLYFIMVRLSLTLLQGIFFRIESTMIPSRTAEAIKLEHFQIDNQKSGVRGDQRSLTHCSESRVIKFLFKSTNRS